MATSPLPPDVVIPRQQYLQAVQQGLSRLGSQPQNLLVFYGSDRLRWGLGKAIAQQLKPQIPCIYIDGMEIRRRNPATDEQALSELRYQLRAGKEYFTSFDFAFTCYKSLTKSYQNITPANYAKGMDRADRLSTGADLVSAFAGIDLEKLSQQIGLPEVGATMQQLLPYFWDDLQEIGRNSMPLITFLLKLNWFFLKNVDAWRWWEEIGCRELQPLKDCVSPYQIVEYLPKLLARGLQQYLDCLKKPLVILIDDYEALADPSEWLETLISEPNPWVLWVVVARRLPQWMEASERIPILPLTEAESQEVLTTAGISGDRLLSTITEICQGTPYYMHLCVKRWQKIQQRRSPQVEDFAGKPEEFLTTEAATWDPGELRMLQVLAIPREWDAARFDRLMQQQHLETWRGRFAEVIASPYIEEVAEGKWRLNPLMRQYLLETQPTTQRQTLHQELYEELRQEYLQAQTPQAAILALDQALDHAIDSSHSSEATAWVLAQMPIHQQQSQHSEVVEMLRSLLKRLGEPITATTAKAQMLLGYSLVELGETEKALKELETAKAQYAAVGLGDSLEAARVEYELAGVYLACDRTFDAKNAAMRSRQLRQQQLGKDAPEVAEVLNRLAAIASDCGEYREAVLYCDRALDILNSQPQPHPIQLASVKKTAALLKIYNNQLDDAAQLCKEARQLAIEVGGENHAIAIQSLMMLGGIHSRMGPRLYPKSLEEYQKALTAAEEVFGPSHFQTLDVLEAMAELCRKMGQHQAADEYAERHNAYVKVGESAVTPELARRLSILGGELYKKGEYGKAEPLWKQALNIHRKVLGEQHPDTAGSLNNLAALYKSQGRYAEAESLYLQALNIRRKVLGDEHPDTALSLHNLATLYYSQGRYAEVEPLLLQALDIYRKVLRNEHPHTASSLNSLALLYYSQGRYAEVEPLLLQALDIYRKVLGNEHPDTASSLNSLAGLYDSQGRYDEAEPLFLQALNIRRKILGNEHPDTALSLHNLAGLYDSQGRYAEAESLLLQALDIYRKVLGNEHPDTASSLYSLAGLYYFQERYAEAEPLLLQALNIYRKVLGDEHPHTKTTAENLQMLQDKRNS
ncbi:tetratricopeptide repeat protein [Oscillatoria acuminata]|uniref:ATP-dependent transcriptional regulator n=1 Tax=Oscillatoria acuminata PCC 6304 TaxID=56110 RepID=K9TKU4_9CYAN|nr:tetratricopeptide repeat protein [Oscillatoria acuminata]AFY83023.1 ATP-dependent transcriptional regulator [Oscillatoria acuminata PCC 6304]